MIYIDFETRSRCDIGDTGAWRYAEDPSTEVLCMAFAVNDLPVEIWYPGEDMPKDLKYYIEYGFKVEAHNAFFERAIWRNIMVPKFGWPDIPDVQWACSAAKAATHALPRSLGGVGAALHLAVVKNEDGKRVMMKLARPRKATKKDSSEWHNDSQSFRELYDYCQADVAAERAIDKKLRDLTPTERDIWLLDQRINERGIRVDMPAIKAALSIIGEYTGRKRTEFMRLTGIDSPTKLDQFKEWLKARGVPLTSLNKNDVSELLEKNKNLPQQVKDALRVRQELGKSSTAKYAAVAESVCRDGKLRDLLMYHGASTGRWTGKLVQPQNFPKNTFKGNFEQYFEILKRGELDTFEMCYADPMATLSATIRGIFIPSENHVFFGGDYSAIEARVLFWLASESKGLNMFRLGQDIYKDLATSIYNKPFESITKEERDLGKRGVLGCGYGMGAEKFKATCWDFARVEITEELSERVVHAYRTKYRPVVVMWQLQEMAAKQAMETKKTVRCGKVLWGVHDGFLFCRLPSGRCLAYPEPKIELVKTSWGEMKPSITFMGVNPKTKQWERGSTYGGKIVENITQAVARDLMAEAMLRCEAAGFKVVLTVHDELLTEANTNGKEIPKLTMDITLKTFEALMAKLPAWADGIPVKAEGWYGGRYTK